MADDSGATPLGDPSPGNPRRSFVARLSVSLAALAAVNGRLWARPTRTSQSLAARPQQPNVAALEALAAAVLPRELGPDGTARAALRFQRWMEEYRPDEELNHGYGTARLDHTPADPRPRWREQLAGLDADATRRHGQGFASLDVPERRAIVRAALADIRGDGLPSPAAAGHIAIAMLAHFYESTLATDLCYEAEIGRQQCRPLDTSARKPVPLVRRS